MKHYIKSLYFILLCGLLATSCSDDHYVEIDSLNTDGDEFYCNQKVKIWMAVRSDDLSEVDYQWSCEGGRLTQPQGLDEMTWQAPNTPGTYSVSCTVSSGGKSETRIHKMYVSSYFFEKFEKTPYGIVVQTGAEILAKTESIGGITNTYAQFNGKSSTEAQRYLEKVFNDAQLKIPFSTMSKIGFISAIPKDSLTVGQKKGPPSLYYTWVLKRDPKQADAIYPVQLTVEWYPNVNGKMPVTSLGEKFNLAISISYLEKGISKAVSLRTYIPEISSFDNKIYKKFSMSVDKDYYIYIHLDGKEVYKSEWLRTFRTTHNSQDDIYIDRWRIGFPNGTGKDLPVLYLDDAYGANDGTILK
ncbi:hypothetical protein CLV62_10540 [Dysgonomonas alginatilytica]|uniref:PKD family protein n=1 Tax=Dysgonomonas alginatilytica TaxID=1605892 RepID=A0A2V3PTL6_9BACT|nr:hypothetical protein [Dysgonomonas alginatilytica]PXV66289.1 hypothetical protein CLV62_10540 [Dysgonomonas alginatilytica]